MFCKECEKTGNNIMKGIRNRVDWNDPDDNVIFVEHRPNIFHFSVESTGSLPPEEIVLDAFEVLFGKLDYITSELSKVEMEGDDQGGMGGDQRMAFDVDSMMFGH